MSQLELIHTDLNETYCGVGRTHSFSMTSAQYARLLRLLEKSLRLQHEQEVLAVSRLIEASKRVIDNEMIGWAASAQPLHARLERSVQDIRRIWQAGPAEPVLDLNQVAGLPELVAHDSRLVVHEMRTTAVVTDVMATAVETAWNHPLESALGTSPVAQVVGAQLQRVITRLAGLSPKQQAARLAAERARLESSWREAAAWLVAARLKEQITITAYQSFDSSAGARLAERLQRVRSQWDRLEARDSTAALA